jgi:hypothetical protein
MTDTAASGTIHRYQMSSGTIPYHQNTILARKKEVEEKNLYNHSGNRQNQKYSRWGKYRYCRPEWLC